MKLAESIKCVEIRVMNKNKISTKPIRSILYFFHKKRKILELLIKFNQDDHVLFFDGHDFYLIHESKIEKRKWIHLKYSKLKETDIRIQFIKDDWEESTFFVELSNGDILQLYQLIYGYGDWTQDVRIVSRSNNLDTYESVKEYMNGDWINDTEVKNELSWQ